MGSKASWLSHTVMIRYNSASAVLRTRNDIRNPSVSSEFLGHSAQSRKIDLLMGKGKCFYSSLRFSRNKSAGDSYLSQIEPFFGWDGGRIFS